MLLESIKLGFFSKKHFHKTRMNSFYVLPWKKARSDFNEKFVLFNIAYSYHHISFVVILVFVPLKPNKRRRRLYVSPVIYRDEWIL